LLTDREPAALGQVQAELFRLLVTSVKDYAIFLLDPQGRILSWNIGARRVKGYTAAEVVGKHFSMFYPPRDVQHGKPDYALRVAASEGRWEEDGWRIRKDGSRFWANVVITALHDDSGELVGFAKVTRDLTERKRADEERAQLLELEHTARTQNEVVVERLRALQSVTEVALAHLDLDKLLPELLDRIAEILSVDTVAVLLVTGEKGDVLVATAARGIEEEVEQGVRIPVGRGFAGRIAAERRPVILDDVEHAEVLNPILREKGIRSLLGVPLMVEGRVLGVLHVGSLHQRQFTDNDVQLLQIVADRISIAIDHARLFEAAQAARHDADVAEELVRARDEFLSIAAHELKTPLTSLRIAGQSLLRTLDRGDTPSRSALERSLRTVDRQIERMSRLVTHLLDTVRLQNGSLELELALTNLTDLAASVIEQMQGQALHHHVVLHATKDVWAVVDSLRFEQVMVNLLDNAVKYSPEGGTIDVDVFEEPQGCVRIDIRDQGIGVPPEHRPRLFERYYQAHGRDNRSGMGLGLFITREIVERHGGTVIAQFPPEGGTRVVVVLPPTASKQTEGH
jgi:PAS domain S-box-containing protein